MANVPAARALVGGSMGAAGSANIENRHVEGLQNSGGVLYDHLGRPVTPGSTDNPAAVPDSNPDTGPASDFGDGMGGGDRAQVPAGVRPRTAPPVPATPEWTPFRPLRAGDLFRMQEGDDLGEDDNPDPPEDIEDDYLRYRQRQDDRELLDETRGRLNITPPAPGDETITATQGLPALPGGRGTAILGASGGAYSIMRRVVPGVAGDVGRGVLEAPRQALGGVSDAVHSAFSGLDHLATWLNEHVADLRLPSTGVDALDNPLAAIAGDGNQVAAPTTTTGSIVRHAARFLTGFIAAGQALQAVGLEAAVAGMAGSAAGTVAQGTAAGALGDFITAAPNEPNLANLVRDIPVLGELATNPDDPELLNRARNAAVSAGLGLLTEGVLRGVRAVGRARAARSQMQAGPAAAAEQQQAAADAATARLTEHLGDPAGDAAVTFPRMNPQDRLAAAENAVAGRTVLADDARRMAAQAAQDEAAGMPARATVGQPEVMINFARINTPDDVRSVIGQMAERYAPAIDAARRGVRSNEATAEAADALGMSVDQLLARRSGQAFNAEEALASRRLLAASGERLAALARASSGPAASPADLFAFRRMLATHYAIQNEVIGARTEAARALQSWAIPAGATPEAARALELAVAQSGGFDVSRELALRIAQLVDQGAVPGQIAAAVRRGWAARTRDAVVESYVMGLLWNPSTHIANTTGNTLGILQQITDRMAAERVSVLAGRAPGEGVAPGEAAGQVYGLLTGLRDAFRMAGQALRTGETGAGIPGRADAARNPAITAAAFGLDEAGTVGRVVDFLGRATRIPGHLLAASDAFFSSIGYRMELGAQAMRMATSEGLEGPALYTRVGELMSNPPSAITMRAADAALYMTFQNEPGALAQNLMRIRNLRGADDSAIGQMNPMFLVLPYIRTPANIVSYAFEHSPLAPLVGRWRADIAAGGARGDLALARIGTGTALTLLAIDMANNGLVTGAGPQDGAEREALSRQGWQPYSVRLGDNWVSYNRMDPWAMTIGAAANMVDAFNRREIDPEHMDEWQEVVAQMIAAVSRSTIDRNYLRGASDFFALMNDPRQRAAGFVNQQIRSMVPFTSLFASAERAIDPVQRQANDPLASIEAAIPGLSERMPARRDLWGQPVGARPGPLGAVYDWASPVRVREITDSPIDAELVRNRYFPQRIRQQTSMLGVEVNLRQFPEVYSRYVELAGNAQPVPQFGGLGLRDYLNAVVTGEGGNATTRRDHERFQRMTAGPRSERQQFFQTAFTRARQTAAAAILADPMFADFRDYYEAQAGRRAERRPNSQPRFTPPPRIGSPSP